MLPMPETTRLVEQHPLDAAARAGGCRRPTASRSRSGSNRSRAMWATSARQLGAARAQRQAAEHALVDEPQLAVRRRRRSNTTRHVRRQRGAGRVEPELAAHAEVGQQGVAVGEGQPQVLAAPARLGERAPGQGGGEVVRARRGGARTGRGCRTVTPAMRRPVSSGGQAARGRPRPRAVQASARGSAGGCVAARRTRSRPRPARPASWSVPAPGRTARSPTMATRLEALVVVGPGLGDPVAGRAELALGAELLQAGLPVQAGAERGGLDRPAGRRGGGRGGRRRPGRRTR